MAEKLEEVRIEAEEVVLDPENPQDDEDIWVVEIEDNTFDQEDIVYESNPRGKNWVAIVERNLSKPSGLARRFLRRVGRSTRVFASAIRPGHWLEVGADYYTARQRCHPCRYYFLVLSISQDEMVLRQIEKSEIGKYQDEDENKNKTDAKSAESPLSKFKDEEILAEARRRGLI